MNIEFKNILDVDSELQNTVRDWRNSDDVKKYMFNEQNISTEEHRNWLKSLENSNKSITFVIFYENSPIGIVSLVNINNYHKTADWGFYIFSQENRGKGIGTNVLYKLINYAFNEINIIKLNCEALETNSNVIQLYKKMGFAVEGIRRKNIVKNEQRFDVIMLGILKEEWEFKKPEIELLINRI